MDRRDFLTLCLAAPLPALAGTIRGTREFSEKGSVASATEVTLMSLIAQFADYQLSSMYNKYLRENGDDLLVGAANGENSNLIKAAFSYPFSPGAPSWDGVSGAMMPLGTPVLNRRYISALANQLRLGGVPQGQSHWHRSSDFTDMRIHVIKAFYYMAGASTAITFSSKVSGYIADQISGQVFNTEEQAAVAIRSIFESTPRADLNRILAECAQEALKSNFYPGSTPSGVDERILTNWKNYTTGDYFSFTLEDGWSYSKGRTFYCPRQGIVNGKTVKLTFNAASDSTFKEQRIEGRGR